MRIGVLGISLMIAIAAPGCGYATMPTPATTFSLEPGNYTLKLSGSGGICSSGPIGSISPVTVSRTGSTWFVVSTRVSDTFAMNFTTDNAAAGSVHGGMSGAISGAASITGSALLSGNNSGTNVAGGPVTSASAGIATVVSFDPSGGGCTSTTWTLEPR